MTEVNSELQDLDNGEMSEAELIMAEEERAAALARGEVLEDDDLDEEDKKKKADLPVYPVAERAAVATQEDLDAVVAAHAEWMEGVLHPRKAAVGGRANLSEADLRAFNLIGVNLSSADLRRANLAGVDLTGANLSAANLEGANLQGVILRGAKLRRTKLADADLRAADFTDAVLTGTDLAVAILTSEDFQKRQAKTAKAPEEVVESEGMEPSEEPEDLLEITTDDEEDSAATLH